MELAFTKGAGKNDGLIISRGEGSTQEIACPKQGIIPHDMMHYAVESILDARGFLGRLRDGEVATFGMIAESDSDSIERLVEVMQGETWSAVGANSDLIDLYRVTCEARGCPMLELNDEIIADIRGRIVALTEAWDGIAVGQTLTLRL
jgi:hypothetical protein